MAGLFWGVVEAHESRHRPGKSDGLGYAVGLLTWVLAGGTFVAGKAAVAEMPPWTFVFGRLLIGVLVLLPLVRHHFPEMRAFLRTYGLHALAVGALGFGITQGLMFTSLQHSSAVNAGIIFSTTPMITLLMARFFLHEPMGPWQYAGSLLAFCGIVVVAVQGSLKVLLGLDLGVGDIIMIGAAIVFSSYTVLLKRAHFQLDRLPLLVILMAGSLIATLPFFLWEFVNGEHANLGLNGYLALAYAAIPGGALMYLLYNWSVEILGAGRAQGLLYSQMVFTAIIAWLVLGESIEWYQYAGGAFIVVGVILVTFLKPAVPKPD